MDTPEIAAIAAETLALQQANDAIIGQLAARGVGIPQDSLTGVRMLTLLDTLLGPADGEQQTLARARYELACQHRFAEMLAEITTQVDAQQRRQILLQGVNGAPAPNGRHR